MQNLIAEPSGVSSNKYFRHAVIRRRLDSKHAVMAIVPIIFVALSMQSCVTAGDKNESVGLATQTAVPRFFFTSQGKTGITGMDGSGLRYFDFQVPGQATWQPGPLFSDGQRVIFLSMEPRRDGPGKPFEEYYTQTPTHIW